MADLKKFLDQQGVSTLWSKIAEKIAAEATARGLAIEDLRSYVGEIPEGYADQQSIVAYINKKAEETLNAANGGSSESAASVKAALDNEILRAKAAEEANAAAAQAADNKAVVAQGEVDALESLVGEVTEGKTVVQMIADAQAAATYDDTVLAGRVSTLEGTDAGKSVRTIANEELAAQLVADDAKESLDTLAEIAAWIQSHPDDASAMNQAIVALQNKVDTGDKTVSAYVADAIAALSIGDYAKAADLTALAGRVKAIEDDYLKAADKTELSNAINDVDGRLATVEGDYLKTADKTELSNAIAAIKDDANIDSFADVVAELAKKQNNIPANTYDASGAAAQALIDAKAYTDNEINTRVIALTTAEIEAAIANA